MIQRLSILDVDQILALSRQCEFNECWSKEQLTSAFNRQDFYVYAYVSEKKIVGYIAFSISLDTADVELVLVHKSYRKKGIASLLLIEAQRVIQSKGVKKILLEVKENNQKAINLYVKNGFSKIHVRKNYYSDLTDAYLMAKEI